jgi:hypothetical protein
VERHYYDVSTLGRTLLALEREYGMASADFYAAHCAGEALESIPGFNRHVWASFYRDFLRLSEGADLAAHSEQVLCLA